jgi:hypothetical protein
LDLDKLRSLVWSMRRILALLLENPTHPFVFVLSACSRYAPLVCVLLFLVLVMVRF